MNVSWLSAGNSANAALSAAFAAAALIVLLALLGFFISARRRAGKKSVRRNNHRISVRDVVKLDERRRLVLIRRDNTEHLLLTGGDSDLVVESFPDGKAAGGGKSAPQAELFAAQEEAAPHGANAAPAERTDNAYAARPQALPDTRPPANRSSVPSYTPAARQAQQAANQAAARAQRAAAARQNAEENERNGAFRARTEGAGGERAAPPYRETAQQAEAFAARRAQRIEPEMRSAEHRDFEQAAQSAPVRRLEPSGQNMRAEAGAAQQQAAQSGRAAAGRAEQPLYKESDFAPSGQSGAALREAERGAAPHNAYAPKSAPPPVHGAESGAALRSAAANAEHLTPRDNGAPPRDSRGRADFQSRQERETRPQAADGVYAPYLGYMPRQAPPPSPSAPRQSAPQTASPAVSPPPSPRQNDIPGGRASSDYDNEPRRDARQEAYRRAAPAQSGGQEQRQWNESEQHDRRGRVPNPPQQRNGAPEAGRQNSFYGYERESERRGADVRDTAQQQPFNPFQDAGRDSGAGEAFETAPRRNGNDAAPAARGGSNGNSFAAVGPADDNDFDKILQDELLRAPNAIRFPSPQKK